MLHWPSNDASCRPTYQWTWKFIVPTKQPACDKQLTELITTVLSACCSWSIVLHALEDVIHYEWVYLADSWMPSELFWALRLWQAFRLFVCSLVLFLEWAGCERNYQYFMSVSISISSELGVQYLCILLFLIIVFSFLGRPIFPLV